MKQNIETFLEKIKTDRSALNAFKNIAVKLKDYEIASRIREIQTENFPEKEEDILIKNKIRTLVSTLKMVDINIGDEKLLYVIYETIKVYEEKLGDFSMKDANEIIARKNDLYYSF